MLKKPKAELFICRKINNDTTIIGKSVISGENATLNPWDVPPLKEAEITKASNGPGAKPTPSPRRRPWIKYSI